MRGLAERVAVITGAGGGIGRALCARLAAEGSAVAVLDRDEAAACSTVAAIADSGGTAKAYIADVTSYSSIVRAVTAIQKDLGPPRILVNNAGIDRFEPFLKTDPDSWSQLIAVNLVGALNVHHVVLPRIVEAGGGRVVNIASDAARVGSSGEAVYAACKAGLIGLTKTLARELATKHITLNVVCPGPTQTSLLTSVVDAARDPAKLLEAFRRAIPIGRLGHPDDIPGVVAFLASEEANFITGQVISVSGGLTMVG